MKFSSKLFLCLLTALITLLHTACNDNQQIVLQLEDKSQVSDEKEQKTPQETEQKTVQQPKQEKKTENVPSLSLAPEQKKEDLQPVPEAEHTFLQQSDWSQHVAELRRLIVEQVPQTVRGSVFSDQYGVYVYCPDESARTEVANVFHSKTEYCDVPLYTVYSPYTVRELGKIKKTSQISLLIFLVGKPQNFINFRWAFMPKQIRL